MAVEVEEIVEGRGEGVEVKAEVVLRWRRG